uniref:G_PROTEIN_RECEP_F1_2 domain-containing protein n=1 Tax=Steinernema glaseri TaxID=37863 RepID=A0A1I7ZJV9_9BILA
MLLVVTVDRFFAVFAPIRYFKQNHCYAWKALLGVLMTPDIDCWTTPNEVTSNEVRPKNDGFMGTMRTYGTFLGL